MPLHHAHKLLMGALMMDAGLCLAPRFSVSGFWEEVRRYQTTVLVLHDQPFVMLLKAEPNRRDRDHPGRVVRPGFRLQRQFHERFGVAVTSVLGNTESNMVALAPWWRSSVDPHYYDTESPGLDIITEMYDVACVDDEDREVPRGEVGELVSRQKHPHTMFEGYFKDPAKTAEAFRNQWYHSGDLAMIDANGRLHFRGRKAHSIRHRGEFVPHEAIENAANGHAAVLASAVVGVPSDLGDEDIKMYVVAREGSTVAPTDLLDYLGTKVSYAMVPRYIEFVPDLPRNPGLDKINWMELRKRGIGEAWDREAAGYKVKRS
jgi:crotonobetaine/carnitine-CoA ligase